VLWESAKLVVYVNQLVVLCGWVVVVDWSVEVCRRDLPAASFGNCAMVAATIWNMVNIAATG
jgi:hypothetical protein